MRLGVYFSKFLHHHNRLNGLMAFFAIWWGLCTLIWPGFWGEWPVTAVLAAKTGGHPAIVSWTLLFGGMGSYIARRWRIHLLRSLCALATFSTWAMLAWIFWSMSPKFAPGFACYSALAFSKFISYVNFLIDIDQEPPA